MSLADSRSARAAQKDIADLEVKQLVRFPLRLLPGFLGTNRKNRNRSQPSRSDGVPLVGRQRTTSGKPLLLAQIFLSNLVWLALRLLSIAVLRSADTPGTVRLIGFLSSRSGDQLRIPGLSSIVCSVPTALNAKTPGRQDAKRLKKILCVLAPLRLCVEKLTTGERLDDCV